MTVRVYRWDDSVGGTTPTVNGVAGSITALLKACLVTGYGSNSSAGWTNPFSGTNIEVFRNGASGTQNYLRVDHSSGRSARVVGYQTMSALSTGTNPVPTAAQVSGGEWVDASATADSTARPWMILANDKWLYLWIGYSDTTTTGLSAAYPVMYFFGDILPARGDDAAHFTVMASPTTGECGVASLATSLSGSTSGAYIAGTHAQTFGSIPCGKIGDYVVTSATTMGRGGIDYPDAVGGGMLLSEVRVTSSSQIRGRMPGLWNPLHTFSSLPAPGNTFSGSGDLAGKTFIMMNAPANSGTTGRIALETSDTVS